MSDRTVVAIHQPNFFPWLGYFNKIASADVFIILDNVQFSKKGGNWANRAKVLINGSAAWVTMPVVRSYTGVKSIDEMLINNEGPWRAKILNTIRASYGKAPYFDEVFPLVTGLVSNPTDSLAEYNLSAIRSLTSFLNLDASKFVLGSTLDVGGNGTDLLVAMVKAVGGNAYLSGDGAGGYLEEGKFAAVGTELIFQGYRPAEYTQVNAPTFVSGLSIIDALMNCGPETAGVAHGESSGLRP